MLIYVQWSLVHMVAITQRGSLASDEVHAGAEQIAL